MSQSIELVPFYTEVLRTIQQMLYEEIISQEQRSTLKNYVLTRDVQEMNPLMNAYKNGGLEEFLLTNVLHLQLVEVSNSICSFDDVDDYKSTMSCIKEQQMKQRIQEFHRVRKRSNSLTACMLDKQ